MVAKCDRNAVEAFDYSKLATAFNGLSKPARRALVNAGIWDARELARWTRSDVAALHGIGPSVFPVLDWALEAMGLRFRGK